MLKKERANLFFRRLQELYPRRRALGSQKQLRTSCGCSS